MSSIISFGHRQGYAWGNMNPPNQKKSNIIPRPVKNSLMLHYMTAPGDFAQPDWDLAERVSHLSSRSALLLQKTRNSGSLHLGGRLQPATRAATFITH